MKLNQKNKELAANTSLSHYRIVSKIGAGGMGEVFLAEDTKLNRRVALKILPQEFTADKDRMSRFVREAKSASALNHPNIITIHEITEFEATHFIATEFFDGKTLNEYAKTNPLNLKSALEIAIQIASALDEAHSARIVHRDIKPDNVMVRANGLVKILDFGIAKLSSSNNQPPLDAEAATAIKSGTSPGLIIGSVNYMSPEQATGKEVDARTDIFSFGVVLHELVAGKLPFEGETAMEMIGAILHKEPKPLNKTEVPLELEKIIGKCLRKDRDERYQTIRDVLIDLKDVKQELEFQDKLDRTAAPNREDPKTQLLTAPTTDEPRPPTSSAEFITQEVKRHKRGVAFGSLMLLALLGVGIWFFLLRSTTDNAPIDSIAVLPFQNRSADADTEYLSDGLAESLIYRLSQLPNLKVSPTSSVFRYKGKETDAVKVGNELGVRAVMTGRMVQRGDSLTISVELVDVRTGRLLWGEQYERKMSELLATQREIATTITEKLQVKLSGEGAKGITKRYTESNEAYQLYLKGRFLWNKRTGESLKRAVEFYDQAIEKDPGFALAFAGLAETYVLFPNYEVAPPADCMPQAKAAALRALELDESVAEAHTALGWYFYQFEFDWISAERELRRAIEINPNYATAHQWLGELLAQTKRFDEGQAETKLALEADPLSPVISFNIGWQLYLARRYDESIREFNRTLSLHSDFPLAQTGLCWATNVIHCEILSFKKLGLDLSRISYYLHNLSSGVDSANISTIKPKGGSRDLFRRLRLNARVLWFHRRYQRSICAGST